jgi:2'-5' RNA ligase
LPLSADAAAAVSAIVEQVRSAGLPNGARDVRWVRLDGLHLTVRFLGPTPEDRVEAAAAAVETAARTSLGPVDLVLTGAGAFPRPARPRALWIGVGGDTTTLAELAARTDSALVAGGWQPAERPFQPHLTLARSDGVSVGPLVAERLAAAMRDRAIDCRIDRIGLFQSVTGGGPARYVPVTLEPLGPASPDGSRVYHQTTPDPS